VEPRLAWNRSRLTTIQSSAFSPCNITGFFQIHDSVRDPLRVGSTGVGVALSTGLTTRVSIQRTRHPNVVARFNGRRLPVQAVSNHVARKYLELDDGSWQVKISHECRFQFGRGYGTSGAGALSLSLALNDAMGLSFSMSEAAQIAHLCEVETKTGLGTVASVFSGGLTVRTRPGTPEIGHVRKLSLPSSLRIVSGSFGPISTRRVLSSHSLKKTINTCGRALIEKFLRDASYLNFMITSQKFSDCVGLISSRLRRVMNALNSSGFTCSMMMLGESLFCLVSHEDSTRVEAILRGHNLTPTTSQVAQSGARLI
jgi:pantoate kinase